MATKLTYLSLAITRLRYRLSGATVPITPPHPNTFRIYPPSYPNEYP